jgi:hypothetical protein
MALDNKTLLWVDDDGERRFRYERRILAKEGWDVMWAEDINTARLLLSTDDFDALILDQRLPFEKERTPTGVEGGYLLLHWVRLGILPEQFELPQADNSPEFEPPKETNRRLQVLFISAYYDEDLQAQMQKLNGEHGQIEITPKPVDPQDLLRFVNLIKRGRSVG